MRQWVLSCPYPLRFLFASKPDAISPVLAMVQRVIAGWLADQAGVERSRAQCGAVTLIQCFGSALNLNVHFHMLWFDGVYEEDVEQPQRKPRLHRARAPTSAQLTQLADTIARRVCRHLARKGWLEGEDESVFLTDSAGSDDDMDRLRMNSITYRIAIGAQVGRKVVILTPSWRVRRTEDGRRRSQPYVESGRGSSARQGERIGGRSRRGMRNAGYSANRRCIVDPDSVRSASSRVMAHHDSMGTMTTVCAPSVLVMVHVLPSGSRAQSAWFAA